MVAPKKPLLTMPLGQARRFEPLPSAKRKRVLTVESESRLWMANAPGENYAREVTVQATGAWANIQLPPPAPGLTEVLRVTLEKPDPVTIFFHPWIYEEDAALNQIFTRFRFAQRLYAHVQSAAYPAMNALEGRIILEFGVGKARNWTYLDVAPGALQIPNCNWLAVYGWSNVTNFVLAATAQVGYSHAPLDCTWSQIIVENVGGVAIVNRPPHYAREVTGYFYGGGLAAEGNLALQDALLTPFQYFLMRSAVTPNPPVIPYAPVNIPLAGGVAAINSGIVNPGVIPALCTCTATCRVRV
jgi:hypothetical protein